MMELCDFGYDGIGICKFGLNHKCGHNEGGNYDDLKKLFGIELQFPG